MPAEPVSLGGRYTLNAWPRESSWDFVGVGRGHDIEWWTEFLRALRAVDPEMAVNIEHEDLELRTLAGLQVAATALAKAVEVAGRVALGLATGGFGGVTSVAATVSWSHRQNRIGQCRRAIHWHVEAR